MEKTKHTMVCREFQQSLPMHTVGNNKWRPAHTGYEQNSLVNTLLMLFIFAHQISPQRSSIRSRRSHPSC